MMPMRARTSLRALALATLVTAALSSPVGSASATGGGSVGSRLSSARQQQAMAIAAVKAIRSKLPGLEARLAQLEKQAGEATIAALNALRAEQSGIRVHDFAQQLARIRAARAQQQARQQNLSGAVLGTGSGISIDPTWFDGRNQDQLLALLGPDGGRTCTIPSGLKDTGQQISGDASWYGWDFAGQSTASGATFD